METALWLTDRFSEQELQAMSDAEVKETYDRLKSAARGTVLETLLFGGRC
jgi:hypothetical protein